MENIFQKISEGRKDEDVHREFVKFSKGVFDNKYLLDAKKQKAGWSIKAGAEFANFLVKTCASKAQGEIHLKGVIVSTMDLRKEVPFPHGDVKQFMGIKQLVIDTKTTPDKLLSLMEKQPKAFYALSFVSGSNELKIKPKAPKSAKPASGGEKEPKAEFCSLKTSDYEISNSLFFDMPDFKEISVNHSIVIKEIELPKGETDPVKIRENAIRKGIIRRRIIADGKETVKEYPFEA